MKKLSTLLAVAALTVATPLKAAHDTGLILPDSVRGFRGQGVGVTAGIKITLGPDRVVKRSERVKLGVTAGPVFVLPDTNGVDGWKRIEPSLASFELKPGYSASFNLSGNALIVDYTQLGAAEDDDGGQDTGDKVAWVAAVAGVVAVVVIGGVFIAARANSD
jgi:hypothetical protein